MGVGRKILESTNELLLLLLGKTVVDFPAEHLVNCRSIAAWHFANMYNTKLRMGMGLHRLHKRLADIG